MNHSWFSFFGRVLLVGFSFVLFDGCIPYPPGSGATPLPVGEIISEQQEINVDVLRWEAMEDHYSAIEADQLKHLVSVQTDRWQAMASAFEES